MQDPKRILKLEDDEAFKARTNNRSSGCSDSSNKRRKGDTVTTADAIPKQQQGGTWCWVLPEDGIETHYRHLDFIPDGSKEDSNDSNWENSPSFFDPSTEETNNDNNNCHELSHIDTEDDNHITNNDNNNTIDTTTTIGNRTINDDESPAASTDANTRKDESSSSSTATRNDRERNSIADTHGDNSCSPSFWVPSNDDFEGGKTKDRDSAEMNQDDELPDTNAQDSVVVPSDNTAIVGLSARDTRWMKMYQRLIGHKTKYNSTRVPRRYKADPQLGLWVHTQRSHCTKKNRIDLLNAIGFEWELQEKRTDWGAMYQRLLTYKKEHGTTRVPYKYKGDPQLGMWVYNQRRTCKENDRIDLLNVIGFNWQFKEYDWGIMYQHLVTHKEMHGTTWVPQFYKADPHLGRWVSRQRHSCKEKYRIDLLNDIGFVWNEQQFFATKNIGLISFE